MKKRLNPPGRRMRHKHLRIDQRKLDEVRRALGAKTDTEAVDEALGLVAGEARINRVLRRLGGRLSVRKVFP